MAKSVLQNWVMELGLRHQGVLLTAVRGCDTAPKNDPSKMLVRCYRSMVLNCHCGDPSKAVSFIERVAHDELYRRMRDFLKNLDHYPHHYVMHLAHAAEIIGYKNRVDEQFGLWLDFYFRICKGLHVNPESEQQLDERLNASEEEFKRRDDGQDTLGQVPINRVQGQAPIPIKTATEEQIRGDAYGYTDAHRGHERPR